MSTSWGKKLAKIIKENPQDHLVKSEQEAIRNILSSDYVFFGDTTPMRYFTDSSCSIYEMKNYYLSVNGRLAYEKNLPFRDVIDRS